MARQKMFLSAKGKLTGIPPGTSLPFDTYVYQKTTPELANYVDECGARMQVRRHVPQYNPQTPAQMGRRGQFAIGVAAYKALTEPDKQQWRTDARPHHLNGFQYFMKIWCNTHPPLTGTAWDGGSTTWDSGSTTWDI